MVQPLDQHQTAAVEQMVPAEAEILALDDTAGQEAGTLVAPRIKRLAAELYLQRDGTGDIADGELPVESVVRLVDSGDGGAAETQLGEVLGVEEVRRAQVRITLGVSG